jgi:FkbM family methyltransferase
VYQALALNVMQESAILPYQAALGAVDGYADFSYYSGRSGVAAMVSVQEEGDLKVNVPVIAIDSLNLKHVRAIVLDIEGYEPEALRGAIKTIARDHPVIMAELLPKSQGEIEQALASMGYVRDRHASQRKKRDGVFVWQA